MKRLVRGVIALYPARVRERYGDEIRELLADSPRPVRDACNILRYAIRAQLEEPMRRDVIRLVSLVVAGLSLMAFGFALNDLERGVAEVPEHWWSSLAAGFCVTALTVTAFCDGARRRVQRGRGLRS